jgi:hypothetical protein
MQTESPHLRRCVIHPAPSPPQQPSYDLARTRAPAMYLASHELFDCASAQQSPEPPRPKGHTRFLDSEGNLPKTNKNVVALRVLGRVRRRARHA